MSDESEDKASDPEMDPASLYREEVFTDRKVGSIRRLTPVKPDGSPDSARKVLYLGESQLLTSAGALPLSFELEASSLDEAAGKFGETMKQAFQEAMEEIRELRRRASSSLVLPGSGGALAGPGGPVPGALPGVGRIKLP